MAIFGALLVRTNEIKHIKIHSPKAGHPIFPLVGEIWSAAKVKYILNTNIRQITITKIFIAKPVNTGTNFLGISFVPSKR